MSKGLTIVVPYFNDTLTAPECLEAVRRSRDALNESDKNNLELILVDDGSTSDYPTSLPIGSWARILKLEENGGVGWARNQGLRVAKYPYVLFLDSDIILEPEALPRIFQLIAKCPEFKIFQGVYSPIPANTPKKLFHEYMALTWRYNQLDLAKVGATPGLVSGCFVTSKSYFTALGGFISTFKKSGGEEFEILQRLNLEDIQTDTGLQMRHHFDAFNERMAVVFRRAMNLNDGVGKNHNIPTSFKIRCGIRSLLGLGMYLGVAGTFVFGYGSLLVSLTAILSLAVYDFTLFRFIFKESSLYLAAVSIFFLGAEYAAISLGMALSGIGINTNVKKPRPV